MELLESAEIQRKKSELSISLSGDKNCYHRVMFFSRLFLHTDTTETTF